MLACGKLGKVENPIEKQVKRVIVRGLQPNLGE
jgi:hypothetical protein